MEITDRPGSIIRRKFYFSVSIFTASVITFGVFLWIQIDNKFSVVGSSPIAPFIISILPITCYTNREHFRTCVRPSLASPKEIWRMSTFRKYAKKVNQMFLIVVFMSILLSTVSCLIILVGQIKSFNYKNSYIETQCSVNSDCEVKATYCNDIKILNLSDAFSDVSDTEDVCQDMVPFGCFLEKNNPCESGFKLMVAEARAADMASVVIVGHFLNIVVSLACVISLKKTCTSKGLVVTLLYVALSAGTITIGILARENKSGENSNFRVRELISRNPTPECYGFDRSSFLIRNNETYTLGYGPCDGVFSYKSPVPDDLHFNKTSTSNYNAALSSFSKTGIIVACPAVIVVWYTWRYMQHSRHGIEENEFQMIDLQKRLVNDNDAVPV